MNPAEVVLFALGVYFVLVALLVGSFINLAADRLPRGESLVRPRSHCRSCARLLNMWDLLPVAGYLLRRGRCATCGSRIGISSPVVEALCGASMLTALLLFGLYPGGFVGLGAVALIGLMVVGAASLGPTWIRTKG